MTRLINLYSDTVTHPTPAMREVIANAEVGDDMVGEDPTVNRLEAMAAELFGKEAAVFACSGTQSNQMGLRAHCQPGDELLIDSTGHIANYEGGAPAALSGISVRTLQGDAGRLDVDLLEGQIHADDQHLCPTRLVCVENTTNVGGGRTYPLEQLERIGKWSRQHGLGVHMDGARFFNACVARDYTPAQCVEWVDTVSICFSKGLGCPMGSILVGSSEHMAKARRARKMFGGALRQAGIVAAAAVYALENHVERLAEDHANAKALAEQLADVDGLELDLEKLETNLVFFRVDPELGSARDLAKMVLDQGVKLCPMGPQLVRACTHLDVTREDMDVAARVIRDCVASGVQQSDPSGMTVYGDW